MICFHVICVYTYNDVEKEVFMMSFSIFPLTISGGEKVNIFFQCLATVFLYDANSSFSSS